MNWPKSKPEFYERAKSYLWIHTWVALLIVVAGWLFAIWKGASFQVVVRDSEFYIRGLGWMVPALILAIALAFGRRVNKSEFESA